MDANQSNCPYKYKGLNKPQGNTYPIYLEYQVNNVIQLLPEGFYFLVGIFDFSNNLIKEFTTLNGEISVEDNRYVLFIDHEVSMKMSKSSTMEISVISNNGEIVKHASKVLTITQDPRNNNKLLR